MRVMSTLGFRATTFGETITFLRGVDGAIVTLSQTPDGDFNTHDAANDLDRSLALQDRLEPLGERFLEILANLQS